MRVVSIVGARPQFVKLSPIAQAAQNAGIDHVIIHTGQHYDHNMSDVFFSQLDIPSPDLHLGVGSATHAQQTAGIMTRLEEPLIEARPDWVLVYGDTNSTLAAAVTTAKAGLPLAHLEAGLRSFNRSMPEELNRVLTDHASDLLLAPTQTAMDHLAREGLAAFAKLVGDVMVDVCIQVQKRVATIAPKAAGVPLAPGEFAVATIHRPNTTDDSDRLRAVIKSLQSLPLPVILPVHPRLRKTAADLGLDLETGAVKTTEPLGYEEMVNLVSKAYCILTDSGGLQKEAYILGVPCITLKSDTEWVETLEGGWNQLTDDFENISKMIQQRPHSERLSPFGHGNSADNVIQALALGHAR